MVWTWTVNYFCASDKTEVARNPRICKGSCKLQMLCCILTFPACWGQVFLPGGASRTVHSSLLLSGECWWASICERQRVGGEPPNTPLIPLYSQGKRRDVQIQWFLLPFSTVCFCKLLLSHFIPLFYWEKRVKHLITAVSTCWVSGEACQM